MAQGCGEDCLYVGPDKLKVWPLPDPHNKTLDDVRIIRDNIKALVLELAREKGWRLRRAASS